MKVDDVMSREPATCVGQTTLEAAAGLMWDRACGVLPVVDGRRIVGVITDRDICMCAYTQGRRLAELRVDQAMSNRPIVAKLGESIDDVEATMRTHHVHRLPVIDDDGDVVGVVSLSDVARVAAGKLRSDAAHGVAATLGAVAAPRGPLARGGRSA